MDSTSLNDDDVTVVDLAHDILVEENVFNLHEKACGLWEELYCAVDYDDPADIVALLDEIRDAHERLEALVPAIFECASRASERQEYSRAVVAGEIEPPPEGF